MTGDFDPDNLKSPRSGEAGPTAVHTLEFGSGDLGV